EAWEAPMRPLLLTLALVACSTSPSTSDPDVDDTTGRDPVDDTDPGDPGDPVVRPPPPSGSVQRSIDGRLTYVLDVDLGAVVAYDASGPVQVLAVGAEPTRMARLGDAWFVTLRADGEIVRLAEQDGALVETGRAWIGT